MIGLGASVHERFIPAPGAAGMHEGRRSRRHRTGSGGGEGAAHFETFAGAYKQVSDNQALGPVRFTQK